MKRVQIFPVLCLLSAILPLFADENTKQTASGSIDKHSKELISLSDQVWQFAETAFREHKSSKAVADYAEQQGFKVERGVAQMPTAFIATYGSGKPVIAILGEFDALPGLSQKTVPKAEPLQPGAPGHGCGHNLFSPASLGAAVAIKELMEQGKLKGTIRFYGTPAEEDGGGKIWFIRGGLFKDVDVTLAWHPGTEIEADTGSTQAVVTFYVEFRGKAAHAARDPWNGRSALDGVELFTHALNMMREHITPTSRMHYVIQDGGKVPNVIPDYARLYVWLRDSKRTGVDELMKRVEKIAEGTAIATGTESKIRVEGGSYEMLANMAGERVLHSNLTSLGPLKFTEEEQEYARKIQRATNVEPRGLLQEVNPFQENPEPPEGGSTDVADVSWVVPTIHLTVTTAPVDAPWHGWPVVACGGMSIGHKGMLYASRALALTMVDLFENEQARAAIKKEFTEQTKGHVYKSYAPEGPPPIPKDETEARK